MYVYRYYLRTEPEYWSLHYMLLSGIKEGIDTHLISEVIKMQYGDDVTHKEVWWLLTLVCFLIIQNINICILYFLLFYLLNINLNFENKYYFFILFQNLHKYKN